MAVVAQDPTPCGAQHLRSKEHQVGFAAFLCCCPCQPLGQLRELSGAQVLPHICQAFTPTIRLLEFLSHLSQFQNFLSHSHLFSLQSY